VDDRVQTKLDFIQKASSAARDQAALYRRLGIDPAEVGGTPAEALRPAILSGVKYELQTCIQAMIDVAYHVSAKSFHAAPQDAYDAFERLVAGGALPRARLTVYRKMIGFRNLVVHGYETVDTGMVLAQGQAGEKASQWGMIICSVPPPVPPFSRYQGGIRTALQKPGLGRDAQPKALGHKGHPNRGLAKEDFCRAHA